MGTDSVSLDGTVPGKTQQNNNSENGSNSSALVIIMAALGGVLLIGLLAFFLRVRRAKKNRANRAHDKFSESQQEARESAAKGSDSATVRITDARGFPLSIQSGQSE